MATSALEYLKRVEAWKSRYGPEASTMKGQLLRVLEKRRLPSAQAVLRLHEILCFLHAYPDDVALLIQVEKMLAGFAKRGDTKRFRRQLADTGIAGTPIHYRFFWPMARWLARRWSRQLHIDWRECGNAEQVLEALPLLVPYSEIAGFEELDFTPRQWLERLKGPGETNAAFLVRRIGAMKGGSFLREALHDRLDLPFRLDAAPGSPTRTGAKYTGSAARRAAPAVVYQRAPLDRSRPDLRLEARRRPVAVQDLPAREGHRLVDLAREAMVTRARDLDVFAYGDPRDVRLVDFGEGLQFATIGFIPERRPLLHGIYGFLTLKNHVPIGYVLTSALFHHAEVAYNTFETYRGGEAARVFARVLAMTHFLFGARTFSIDPYQLGYGNKEGLQSGAWWFYYKLGFRPRDAAVRRVLRSELEAMRQDPRHRSSEATLSQLSSEHVFFDLRRTRGPGTRRARGAALDVGGLLPLWDVSLGITDFLARRFGADRERGVHTCAVEAAALLGVGSRRRLTPHERNAWERWAPLVMAIPEVRRWSEASKRSLAQVIVAKGGRRDSDFVRLFDAHRPLQRAVLRLAARAGA